MNSETKTVVGVVNIVGGKWVAEAPHTLAVREPVALRQEGAKKGDLFVVVDLADNDPSSATCRQLAHALAETVRNTYYRSSSGIIASLRRALVTTGTSLEKQAVGANLPAQLGGLAAVAVRGQDVFIATLGSVATYVVMRGSVTQFPERSPWPAADVPVPDRQAGVTFFHVSVESGDMVILADSRFAAFTTPQRVAQALVGQGVEDALTSLGDLADRHDCTALVVEVRAEEKAAPWPLRKERAEARQASGERWWRSRPVLLLQRGLAHLGNGLLAFAVVVWAGLRTLFKQMLPERGSEPATSMLPPQSKGGVAKAEADLPPQSPAQRGRGKQIPFTHAAPRRPPGSAGGWGVLRGRRSDVGEGARALSLGQEAARPAQVPRLPAPLVSQAALRTVALIIPVIVAIVVGMTYWRKGITQTEEYGHLMEQAQVAYQQSLTADAKTARGLLVQAEMLLAQAATIKPDDATLAELQIAIARQQDKVNHVEWLYFIGRLRSYDNPLTRLRRVVCDGMEIYVLDSGLDQVYHHRLTSTGDSLQPDEGNPVLVHRAQQVGSSVVGELIDMTWLSAIPKRQISSLLILEAGGLLEYDADRQLRSLPIGGREQWMLPVAAMGYGSNFYILDAQAGQIFRYLPRAGAYGYPDPPDQYVSQQLKGVLSGAVDMAIDGYIYVLYADGMIRKFESGSPVPFDMGDLDQPLSNPTAIFTAPDQQVRFVYVADAGNRRIVQLDKNGHFVHQLKSREEESVNFEGLGSIFVDELTGRLYFVDSNALYVASIPQLQPK
jgi:hypothetical protein